MCDPLLIASVCSSGTACNVYHRNESKDKICFYIESSRARLYHRKYREGGETMKRVIRSLVPVLLLLVIFPYAAADEPHKNVLIKIEGMT